MRRSAGSRTPVFPGVLPGDEDLDEVVQHLGARFSPTGLPEQRSADDPEVRWCLEAGVRALFEEFCAFEQGEHEAVLPANELLGAVSLRRVMDAYADLLTEHGRDPGHASRDRVLRRWGSTTAFQRDVLRYLYRPGHERARHAARGEELALLLQLPLGEVVALLGEEEARVQNEDPVMQLQVALQAAFPADARLQALVHETYERRLAAWAPLYERVAGAYGVTLTRDDFDYLDLAGALNTIVEGVRQRTTSHPSLGRTRAGASLAVELIGMVLSQLDGRPWRELALLRATGEVGPDGRDVCDP